MTYRSNDIQQIKSRIRFDDLFQELCPDNSREQGNSICPFHDDQQASFQVTTDHGYCHAGCKPPGSKSKRWDIFSLYMQAKGCDFKTAVKQLTERAGITAQPKPSAEKPCSQLVATYDYRAESGALLYQVCRFQPKAFRQRRPDRKGGWLWNLNGIQRVPYRLRECIAADEIWILEGERDADNLHNLGLCGTTSPQGAGKWGKLLVDGRPPECLKGKCVYVIPDNDEAGRKHAHEVARSLHGFSTTVKILTLPGLAEKQDVSDFIEKHGPEEAKRLLLEIAGRTSEYEPVVDSPMPQKAAEVTINLTDWGNSQRMNRLYGDRIRYCKHFGWLVYDGTRWVTDDLSRLQAWAKQTIRGIYVEASKTSDEDRRKEVARHAVKCESLSRIQAMIALLPSEPGISVSHEIFDMAKMLLNVVNGTVDLRTGQLRPHSPADMVTKKAPVTFDPSAKAPRWEAFLSEIMNGDSELVDFLQRFLGYCLTGEANEQVWAFFWGKGSNGKTTFLNTVSTILGDYAADTPPETFLRKDHSGAVNNDLARLKGARLITAEEPPDGRSFDPGVLKRLTGESVITCRFLYHESFEYKSEGKLIFCANRKLVVPDNSEAFWRRPLLIPFTRQFTGPEKDPDLTSRLLAEGPGILAWMVRGCLAWQRERLCPPAIIQEAVREYRDENDILAEFLNQYCEIEPSQTVAVSALYPTYKSYCDDNNIRKPLNKQRFNEDLNSRAGITQDRMPDQKRTRIWRGIGLRSAQTGNVVQGDFVRKTCSQCANEGEPCPKGPRDRDANKCQYFDRI